MNDQHGGQCGVHVYVMKEWHQIPILLTLKHVGVGANANNIFMVLYMKSTIKYEGVLNEWLGSKWVCLSCDREFVFQGVHIGNFTFKFNVVLFLIGVHCITH